MFFVHLYPLCSCCLALFLHNSELRESSSPQCGDATSFSSHYVLIRGRYRGGGGSDQKQTQRCTTELHTMSAQARRVRVHPVSKETLKCPVHFPSADTSIVLKNLKYCELLLFVAMPTEICKYLYLCSSFTNQVLVDLLSHTDTCNSSETLHTTHMMFKSA